MIRGFEEQFEPETVTAIQSLLDRIVRRHGSQGVKFPAHNSREVLPEEGRYEGGRAGFKSLGKRYGKRTSQESQGGGQEKSRVPPTASPPHLLYILLYELGLVRH